MSRFLFGAIAIVLALVASIFSEVDLAARCRCDQSRGGGGSRKAALQDHRQAKKSFRRGYSTQAYQYDAAPSPGGNPYGVDGVQVVGAAAASTPAAPVQYRWEQRCTRTGCQWVRVPIVVPVAPEAKQTQLQPQAAPQPIPDPAFEETQEAEKTEAETEASESAKDAAASLDAPVFNADESQATWFPPLVAGAEKQGDIGQGSDIPDLELQ